jgi:hypothetical protein
VKQSGVLSSAPDFCCRAFIVSRTSSIVSRTALVEATRPKRRVPEIEVCILRVPGGRSVIRRVLRTAAQQLSLPRQTFSFHAGPSSHSTNIVSLPTGHASAPGSGVDCALRLNGSFGSRDERLSIRCAAAADPLACHHPVRRARHMRCDGASSWYAQLCRRATSIRRAGERYGR